jgi:hypothetical protein
MRSTRWQCCWQGTFHAEVAPREVGQLLGIEGGFYKLAALNLLAYTSASSALRWARNLELSKAVYAKVVRQLIRRWQERERKQALILVLALVLRTERQGPDSCDLEKEELDRRTYKILSCNNSPPEH